MSHILWIVHDGACSGHRGTPSDEGYKVRRILHTFIIWTTWTLHDGAQSGHRGTPSNEGYKVRRILQLGRGMIGPEVVTEA